MIMSILKPIHYWVAFVAPWPLCLAGNSVDRLMAAVEGK